MGITKPALHAGSGQALLSSLTSIAEQPGIKQE